MPIIGQRPRPYRVHYIYIKGPGQVKIATKDGKPIWDLIKEYIKSLKIEKTFKRIDLLNYIYGYGKIMSKYETTVDHYRNQLTHVKVLKVVSRGVYRKLRNVPVKLTTTQLRILSNQTNWESWFIPLEAFD